MTQLKLYKTKELAALYEISYMSMRQIIILTRKALQKQGIELGHQKSGYWDINQVELIFKHNGTPGKQID